MEIATRMLTMMARALAAASMALLPLCSNNSEPCHTVSYHWIMAGDLESTSRDAPLRTSLLGIKRDPPTPRQRPDTLATLDNRPLRRGRDSSVGETPDVLLVLLENFLTWRGPVVEYIKSRHAGDSGPS